MASLAVMPGVFSASISCADLRDGPGEGGLIMSPAPFRFLDLCLRCVLGAGSELDCCSGGEPPGPISARPFILQSPPHCPPGSKVAPNSPVAHCCASPLSLSRFLCFFSFFSLFSRLSLPGPSFTSPMGSTIIPGDASPPPTFDGGARCDASLGIVPFARSSLPKPTGPREEARPLRASASSSLNLPGDLSLDLPRRKPNILLARFVEAAAEQHSPQAASGEHRSGVETRAA
mmetsp:Transcript_31689/g.50888  ORF Transcript_31689/g.50888 Transcript_31689/m.50888 type:complete len:232 (-) Transcript_31689:2-697(-)